MPNASPGTTATSASRRMFFAISLVEVARLPRFESRNVEFLGEHAVVVFEVADGIFGEDALLARLAHQDAECLVSHETDEVEGGIGMDVRGWIKKYAF